MSGEHDLSTAPELRARLHELGDANAAVIVDLDQTTFVDSSILGVLVGGLRRARERRCAVRPRARRRRPPGHPPHLRADRPARRLPDLSTSRAEAQAASERAGERLVTAQTADVDARRARRSPTASPSSARPSRASARRSGADARTVGDIKLAATEACTNVVLHAYAGRDAGHDRARRAASATTSCSCWCATAATA